MIITRTPFRLSFFGGGTDYPAWYLREGGAVLSTTIDKYCYLTVRVLPPFFAVKHRVVWSHVETVGSIAEILHPAVREGLRQLGFDDTVGIEIHHQADLPARAGMGSSSAFAVGLLKALSALRGAMIGKHDLALGAIELEQQRLREVVGSQDQVASAYGGLNLISFGRDGGIAVDPVTVSPQRLDVLQNMLLLFFTGTSRLASEVARTVVANFDAKREVLRQLRAMVDDALAILSGTGPLEPFGELLHEAWMLKRTLAGDVETPVVEDVYRRALKAGAIGGKLLGAGGSGFMVFVVPPVRQAAVVRALQGFVHVPFRFECEGSKVVYYGPETAALGPAAAEASARTAPVRRRGGGVAETRA